MHAFRTKAIPRASCPRCSIKTTPGARITLRLLALIFSALFARAAEVIPPRPPDHFNDFAGIVRRETATQLNRELAQFERDTSNQIVVAIYPRMQSASSVDDYAVRVAQRWGVGQKDRKNGAVLFLFQESRDVRIVTGYGLESVLPDALCKQIVENEIVPRFRAGDFDGGLTAGVRAMLAATRGEYRGSGRTLADARGGSGADQGFGGNGLVFAIFFGIIIMSILRGRSRRSAVFGRGGRRNVWLGNGPWGGGGFGGGGWGGGGGASGGGSFSAGGGSFGGGGAGGKW